MRKTKWILGMLAVVSGAIAIGCITDPGAALELTATQADDDGTFRRRGGRDQDDGARGVDNGNANESAQNGNDNKGAGNGNDNGGAANTNDNGGVANTNDNSGTANTNDNSGTANTNDNGGAANTNDNGGTANGNDNGTAATCPDGSDRLRIDPMPYESRARWHRSTTCRWFNVRTQDWPQSSVTVNVAVNGVVVGQMSIDDRGRGELTFDSSFGTMPAGFVDLQPGDVVSIDSLSSGALLVDCSMLSACGS